MAGMEENPVWKPRLLDYQGLLLIDYCRPPRREDVGMPAMKDKA
jgi:hypothetical protein